MTAGDFALQVLAGGTGETVSVLPYAIAAAIGVLVIAGTGLVLLFKGRARWRRIRGEVGDDTLDLSVRRHPAGRLRTAQPAPWPDGDTIIADDVQEALRRMLKEDGRDG